MWNTLQFIISAPLAISLIVYFTARDFYYIKYRLLYLHNINKQQEKNMSYAEGTTAWVMPSLKS